MTTRTYAAPASHARSSAHDVSAEPSMEEILASIRRIIADDEQRSAALLEVKRGRGGAHAAAPVRPKMPPSAPSEEEEDPGLLSAPEGFDANHEPADEEDFSNEAPPPMTSPQDQQPLLSRSARAQISHSFETLCKALLLRDGSVIEKEVREAIQPLLRDWVEAHVPGIVERLVQVEISRLLEER